MHTPLSSTLVVFLHLCSQLVAASPVGSPSVHRGGILAREREIPLASGSSSHIKLKRNHAAQHERRNNPRALETWAERQAERLRRRYGGQPSEPIDHTCLSKRQKGYVELQNMYADTEVRTPGTINET